MTNCSKCNDTGSLSRDVYDGTLDCTHCGVATERAALLKWWTKLPSCDALTDVWLVYQRGKSAVTQPEAKAAPVDMKSIRSRVIAYGSLVHQVWPLAPMAELEKIMAAIESLAAAGNSQGQAAQPEQQPVAYVDEGDEGLFISFVHGPDGSPLKRGDQLYAAPVPAAAPEPLEDAKGVLLTENQRRAASLFGCWWSMVQAERDLAETPIDPEAVVLHFMGCGASCMVHAKDLTEISGLMSSLLEAAAPVGENHG